MGSGRLYKPMALREANGRVHMSIEDKERRRAAEAAVTCPFTDVEPPEYLETEKRKKRFRDIAYLLQATNETLCTKLDEDALARYVISEEHYLQLSKRLDVIIKDKNAAIAEIDKAQRMEKVAFDEVRSCANDMGLTISSRLKFIDLKPVEKPKENPFAAFEK